MDAFHYPVRFHVIRTTETSRHDMLGLPFLKPHELFDLSESAYATALGLDRQMHGHLPAHQRYAMLVSTAKKRRRPTLRPC